MGHPDVVLLYYGPVTIFIGVVNFTFNPRAPTKNGCNFACIQLLGYTDWTWEHSFVVKKKKKKRKTNNWVLLKMLQILRCVCCQLQFSLRCKIKTQSTLRGMYPPFFFWLSGPQPIAYSFILDNDSGLKRQTGWELRLLGPLRVTGI